MDTFLRDLRYSVRRLRTSPGVALVAILIVALGIGANSAVFSLVNAVLFRPQPYDKPEELVNIYVSDSDGRDYTTASYPEYRDFKEQARLFAGTVALEPQIVSRTTDDGSKIAFIEAVSANYWEVLGLRLFRGRGFLPEEESGGGVVAVINYQMWDREFGADPGLIGRTVRLNGAPVTIVGIGPKDYRGVIGALTSQFWMPSGSFKAIDPEYAAKTERRGSRSTWVRARLQPGVSVQAAQSAIDIVMQRLGTTFPESNAGRKASVVPADGVRFHPAIDGALYPVAGILLLVVALVLAIACSNIASLMLARATARQREMALRLAIGAHRGQLVRQLLTESVLIASIGGLVGIGVAQLMVRAIMSFQPPIPIPVSLDLSLDGRVVLFSAILTLGTGILFGLAPALRATRPDLVRSLKDEESSATGGRRRFSLRNGLVVLQVSVSVLLLAGAGLFVRSLGQAQGIDPGFEAERAAILTVSLGHGRLNDEQGRELLRVFSERIAAAPGVRSVALADRIPLGAGFQTRGVWIDQAPPPSGQDNIELDFVLVGPRYFQTLGIALVAGRDFASTDLPGSPHVVIVSEAMARKYWGRPDIVGEHFRMGGANGSLVEIVGVARDTKVRTLGEVPRPYVYASFDQEYTGIIAVIAATEGDPSAALAAMRREFTTLAPDVPIFDAKTMTEQLGLALFLPRMAAALLGLFGMIGIGLAGLGLYGVVAFAVTQRTREIGIRMALGADARKVVRLVVREIAALVLTGLLLGTGVALLAMRPLAGILYGVSPADPVTFIFVTGLLLVAACIASYLPARRAVTIDPLVALRSQ
ncbi:MAG: ABC transporter permease [Gemmatimonadales bacterium]|nr:ABC transporter permease [Gemmatimonadales bacterium]